MELIPVYGGKLYVENGGLIESYVNRIHAIFSVLDTLDDEAVNSVGCLIFRDLTCDKLEDFNKLLLDWHNADDEEFINLTVKHAIVYESFSFIAKIHFFNLVKIFENAVVSKHKLEMKEYPSSSSQILSNVSQLFDYKYLGWCNRVPVFRITKLLEIGKFLNDKELDEKFEKYFNEISKLQIPKLSPPKKMKGKVFKMRKIKCCEILSNILNRINAMHNVFDNLEKYYAECAKFIGECDFKIRQSGLL